MAAERAGVPAVLNTCEEFVSQAHAIAALGGVGYIPVVNYPGHIDTYSLEVRNTYISELIEPGNEEGLTTQVEGGAAAAVEPLETTPIIIKSTWDDVITYYRERQWTDGLPIVPPTTEKVEEFLKYTDYPADEILTRELPPSYRQPTPWTVAVNGVMAGCRPEYMPVLIALTKLWGHVDFDVQDSSSTPGWEPMNVLNGPITKQLGFNYKTGVMNAGFQGNSSVGRFWEFFQRNILEIRTQFTEKGTFGQNYYMLIAENDDYCKSVGWDTLSVQRGFKPEDNVVTATSCIHFMHDTTYTIPETTEPWSKNHMDYIGYMLGKVNHAYRTPADMTPLVLMSPVVAQVMVDDGLSKDDVRKGIWAGTGIRASDWERALGVFKIKPMYKLSDFVEAGDLPALYTESDDPNRLVPKIKDWEQIKLVVTGDPGRNRVIVTRQNAEQGYMTSMKIELPENWDALMEESQLRKDLVASGIEFM